MSYFPPPDDYRPPTHCETCGGVIGLAPVIGGYRWGHVAGADHDVAMRAEGWWDTATGQTRHGPGRVDPTAATRAAAAAGRP